MLLKSRWEYKMIIPRYMLNRAICQIVSICQSGQKNVSKKWLECIEWNACKDWVKKAHTDCEENYRKNADIRCADSNLHRPVDYSSYWDDVCLHST